MLEKRQNNGIANSLSNVILMEFFCVVTVSAVTSAFAPTLAFNLLADCIP